jgi:hypothetical protein
MHSRSALIGAAFALTALAQPASAQQRAGVVSQLAWVSGCWQRVARNGQTIDEQWMAPRTEMMLGMSRTVRGDSLIEYEQLRIFERGGRAVYYAAPVRQTPTEFVAASVSDTLVVFENPQHDFPQRVIYRKRGADSLIARIEGTVNGTARGIDFPYSRARCPGS